MSSPDHFPNGTRERLALIRQRVAAVASHPCETARLTPALFLDLGWLVSRVEAIAGAELVRRELADAHRGEVVSGSGRPLEGRCPDHVVTVRLSHEDTVALRAAANRTGLSLEEMVRVGVRLVLAAEERESAPDV